MIPWNKGNWKQRVSEDEVTEYYLNDHTVSETRKKFLLGNRIVRDILKSKNVIRNKSQSHTIFYSRNPERKEDIKKRMEGLVPGMKGKVGFWRGKNFPLKCCEKGKQTRIQKYGNYHSQSAREKYSKMLKGKTGSLNPAFGHKVRWYANTKKFPYRDMFLDSSYEVAYAQYLDREGKNWKRNTEKMLLRDESGEFTYTPDFVVDGRFVEIKGRLIGRSLRVYNALRNSHHDVVYLFRDDLLKLGCHVN